MKRRPTIKYTDMCIWIDNNAYNENGFDEDKMFQYLKDLFYGLSYKKQYFKIEDDYEKYSIYCATHTYLRLTNKRQFLADDDPKKMKRIKSILNFIKKIMYGMKVNYQQENFEDIFSDEFQGEGIEDQIKTDLCNTLLSNTNDMLRIEVEYYLTSIPKIIKRFLKDTPYSKDKKIMNNLYISCLITVLKSLTLSNKNKYILQKKLKRAVKQQDIIIDNIYKEEKETAPTNWHLDKGMDNLIAVYINKINKLIIQDVRSLINDYIPKEEIIESILINPLELNKEEEDD